MIAETHDGLTIVSDYHLAGPVTSECSSVARLKSSSTGTEIEL
jgi:hypothetical protein